MLTLLSPIVTALALLLAVPTLVFVIEVLVGCFRPVRHTERIAYRNDQPVAVIVPAHNEGAGIKPTLDDIKRQLRLRDRLVVVADNCTDDTADVAAASGAEVSIRNDRTKIGKGYALDWGINYLAANPPAIILVIDADCRLGPGAVEKLVAACAESQRPVQSLYLMTAPAGPTINHQVAEFAWRIKNWVRPLGLYAMALPCQLMGTGMAFPWHVIRSANLSNGFIVEDLKLGLELATAGHPPMFCPSAVVTSTFPTSAQGARMQRHRWEQGHIGLILTQSPALFFSAVRGCNKDLLALALDLSVPPITLLATLLTATVLVAIIAAFANSSYPFAISLVSFLLMVAAIILAWFKYARDILPSKSFVLIGGYFLGKLKLCRAVTFGARISRWIRTDRN
jgi:cellulose synthase/poly-beta-1,6-N-acetylglucosamine synthase-like glycosyltransferase